MNNYEKYLILSDLDGTLINSQQKISKENLEAIRYFTERGGRFAVATGRALQNIRPLIKGLVLNGPNILYNGAAVYDFNHEEILQAEFLDKHLLKDYIIFCMKAFPNMVIEIFTPEIIYIITPETNKDPFIEYEKQFFKWTTLEETLKNDWFKVLFYDKHDSLLKAKDCLKDFSLEDNIDTVFTNEFYLEILKKEVSKGAAIRGLMHLPHFRDKLVIAVGDYDNDMEMIKFADIGIAVDNATDSLKQAADRITVNNNENALHDIIYNIIPSL